MANILMCFTTKAFCSPLSITNMFEQNTYNSTRPTTTFFRFLILVYLITWHLSWCCKSLNQCYNHLITVWLLMLPGDCCKDDFDNDNGCDDDVYDEQLFFLIFCSNAAALWNSLLHGHPFGLGSQRRSTYICLGWLRTHRLVHNMRDVFCSRRCGSLRIALGKPKQKKYFYFVMTLKKTKPIAYLLRLSAALVLYIRMDGSSSLPHSRAIITNRFVPLQDAKCTYLCIHTCKLCVPSTRKTCPS